MAIAIQQAEGETAGQFSARLRRMTWRNPEVARTHYAAWVTEPPPAEEGFAIAELADALFGWLHALGAM